MSLFYQNYCTPLKFMAFTDKSVISQIYMLLFYQNYCITLKFMAFPDKSVICNT